MFTAKERHVKLVAVVVPLILNGVLLFTLQQWMQHKFRNLDERASRETAYRASSVELLAESYKAIWTTLCELEAYLLTDFPERLQAESKSITELAKRLRHDYGKVRGQLIFLPDDLCQRTEIVIQELVAHYNTLIDALRAAERSTDPEDAVRLINTAMDALYDGFRRGLDDLRSDFRRASREALLGSYTQDHSSPG
jgi:hypothetical protein